MTTHLWFPNEALLGLPPGVRWLSPILAVVPHAPAATPSTIARFDQAGGDMSLGVI